jgi:hypothetical protein
MDFMNLTSLRAGVSGTVCISTAMEPREYFVRTGKGQPSFPSLSPQSPKLSPVAFLTELPITWRQP